MFSRKIAVQISGNSGTARGKRAVNELRAVETYKKTKYCYQLCLLLSNSNVDHKNYKRNHRKYVSIRSCK